MKPITSFKPIVLLSILSGIILTIIGCIAPITLPDTSETDAEKGARERMAEDNRLVIGIVSDDLLEQLLPIVMPANATPSIIPANATPMAMPANAQVEARTTAEQQVISAVGNSVTWTLNQQLIIESDNVQTGIIELPVAVEGNRAVVTLPDHLDAATMTAQMDQWCLLICPTPIPQPLGTPTECPPQMELPHSRSSDELVFNLPDEGESYSMPLIYAQPQMDTTSTIDEAFKMIGEDSRFAYAGPYIAYTMNRDTFTFLRNSQHEGRIQLPYAQIDIIAVTVESFNDPSLAIDMLYDPLQTLSQTPSLPNDIPIVESVEEFNKEYQDALCPDGRDCMVIPPIGPLCKPMQ